MSENVVVKSKVVKQRVTPDEDGMRIDRWFKKQYPNLTHIQVEKLMRKGEIRLDGGRVKGKTLIQEGQEIRVPPIDINKLYKPSKKKGDELSDQDVQFIKDLIIYQDKHIIALNKPAGLAVQGGSKTNDHIDRLLPALQGKAEEPPKLVHRLDKETAGILLLAKDRHTAKELMHKFQQHEIEKTYWAFTDGIPIPHEGCMEAMIEDKKAATNYRVINQAAQSFAHVELQPLTGRKHQIRRHMLQLEAPVYGDDKYQLKRLAKEDPSNPRADFGNEIGRGLHLCAKRISLTIHGSPIMLEVPLPSHMQKTWNYFGFDNDCKACTL